MFTRHKKHQIISVKRRFARDKTQSRQGLSTPVDWKCLIRCSSSLVKITICSAFWGSSANRTQNSRENSKPFWRLRLGRGSVGRPISNGEGFRGIQHSVSTVLNTRFHIWFIMRLYYKMRQILLQNATIILL